ncbi:hypothetical protein GXN76_01730 [Kroppenstedtia pulmonis]|uniref:Uncharacterized protein n=1 Tax=Kroppenstedtia pulmonis TaxID=1380685 RepID=A0A7D4BE54_9BACL|nr:hypothetical protein [Kroppenstedtia pulmonis]QKG83312.1 hypothetical protein GXN76_01730 [Kroppenstedtia pulmonis]
MEPWHPYYRPPQTPMGNPHHHRKYAVDYHYLCEAYYHSKKTYKLLKHLLKHRHHHWRESSSRHHRENPHWRESSSSPHRESPKWRESPSSPHKSDSSA